MSKTRLDDSRWPLVVFTAVGEQTEEEFEAYLADCDSLLRRREPYGVIFDARRAAPIGPKLRKRMVEWLARNDALLRAYIVGVAALLTFLVGVSRVALGVHFPSDVLAGWTLGLAWALFCWTAMTVLQRRGTVETVEQAHEQAHDAVVQRTGT